MFGGVGNPPSLPAYMPMMGQVLNLPLPPQPSPLKNWKRTAAKGMGITLILIGCVSFFVQMTWYFVARNSISYGIIGFGIWIGIVYVITGIICLLASVRSSVCLIVSTLVLSIISSIFALVMIGLSAPALDWGTVDKHYYPTEEYHYFLVFGMLFLILGLLGFAISLVASILACMGVCRCSQGSSPVIVYYFPGGDVTQPLMFTSFSVNSQFPLNSAMGNPTSSSAAMAPPSAPPPPPYDESSDEVAKL